MTIKEMATRWHEFADMDYKEQAEFLKALAKCVAYRYGIDGVRETDTIGLDNYYVDTEHKFTKRVDECMTYYDSIRVKVWYTTKFEDVYVERMDTITATGTLKDVFRYIEYVTTWKPVAHDEDAQVVFMDIED